MASQTTFLVVARMGHPRCMCRRRGDAVRRLAVVRWSYIQYSVLCTGWVADPLGPCKLNWL